MLLASPLAGQILPSERAGVWQTVDGTVIKIEYSRPQARGRDSIYGTMEAWNSSWTPGADSATTLTVNKPVHILGALVPAGRYSVWLYLREKSAWSFVLDPRSSLFHTVHP